ncbi:MAG: TrmB family transcriptional regulator [Burkholderiaceae bacterium]
MPPATKLRSSTEKGRADLVDDLQRIGFSEYEARTYISLLQVNPATAYEVSKHSGLPRANTYGALDNLTKKRAVQPVTENPVRYAPVHPETLFDRLSSEINTVCDRLKSQLQEFHDDDRSDVVWSLSSQDQIEQKINELIDSATNHIWIKASTDILRQHLASLQRAAKRGVTLVFVVFGQDTEFLQLGPRTKIYLHEGNGVPIGGADNLFTVAIDFRVALTANVTDELTGAYTTNPSVVRMAETLIRHDFYMAEIMMAFPAQIEERFGPCLVKLRQRMFSTEQFDLLQRNLDNLAEPGTAEAAQAGQAGQQRSGESPAARARSGKPRKAATKAGRVTAPGKAGGSAQRRARSTSL